MASRRLHRLAVALAAGALLASAWPALAQSGQQEAQLCAACHGPLGISTLPTAPNLAGQPESYLAKQLKAYRSGKRVNDMMSLIAKPLSDADIAALAAWYASITVEARARRGTRQAVAALPASA